MDIEKFSKARIRKDKSFDGKFFFAVKTTGIVCRPSCPSPVAKEENVSYYLSIYEALEKGYRPCLRCRPDVQVDYYNGNVDGVELVEKGLDLIYDGFLSDHKVSDLAQALSVSERHLRKLFVDNLGISPVKVAKFHKAMFAKRLLLQSDLKITDIAYASGFGSIRQFNQVMKEVHGKSPSQIREKMNVRIVSQTEGIKVELNASISRSLFGDHLRKNSSRVSGESENTSKPLKLTCQMNGVTYCIDYDPLRERAQLRVELKHLKDLMKIYNHLRLGAQKQE